MRKGPILENFILILFLAFFAEYSFQTILPPKTHSSSGFDVILYIQPGGNTQLTNGTFCTLKESPCSSIQQAINQVLEMYYDRKIIEHPSARFILMPNISAEHDSSKRLIYGKDQCNNSFNRWFYYLLLESMSSEEIIEFRCEGDSLVKPEMFFGLYLMRVKLLDVILRIDEQIVVLYMYEVNATNSEIAFTRKGDDVNLNFDLFFSEFRDGDIQLYASNININGSIIEDVKMYSSSKTSISIIDTKISKFYFASTQDDIISNLDISISSCKLNNTEWYFSNFGNVHLRKVDIFNDFQLSILYSFSISISELFTRGSNVRFYAKFVGISGGIHIKKSNIDSVTNFGNSKNIFDITATPSLIMDNSVFSNNKSPLFDVSVCGELQGYNLQFIGNKGPCIYSDVVKGLSVTSVSISESNFVNNTCSDCSGGALFLKGVGFLGLGSNFVGNSAVNGGACYISASSLELTNAEFKDNRATYKGGAFYVEYVDDGMLDGAYNFVCLNNFAQYSGGCYYSTNRTLGFELEDPVLEGNHAGSYGETFGYPFFDINYLITITYANRTVSTGKNSFPEISLYAGQIISSVEITLWNNQTDRVSYLVLPIEIEVNSSLVLLNYEQKKKSLNATARSREVDRHLSIRCPTLKNLQVEPRELPAVIFIG